MPDSNLQAAAACNAQQEDPQELLPPEKVVHVFGDLHGNTMKLLLQLANLGIITNLHEYFDALEEAYYGDPNLDDHEDQFAQLLDKLEFNPDKIKGISICYVGDMLSDRGENDLSTLRVLKKMAGYHIDYDIIYSNHDAELLRNLPNILDPKQYHLIKHQLFFDENENQGKSLDNFRVSLESGRVSKDEVKSLIENYLGHLKLLTLFNETKSYPTNETKSYPTMVTHAPINKSIAKRMIQKAKRLLDINALGGDDSGTEQKNALSLRKMVDSLNENFSSALRSYANNDEQLFTHQQVREILCLDTTPGKILEVDMVWNRDEDSDHDPNESFSELLDKQNLETMLLIHGHIGPYKPKSRFAMNVDNRNGKGNNRIKFTDRLLDEWCIIRLDTDEPAVVAAYDRFFKWHITKTKNNQLKDYRLFKYRSEAKVILQNVDKNNQLQPLAHKIKAALDSTNLQLILSIQTAYHYLSSNDFKDCSGVRQTYYFIKRVLQLAEKKQSHQLKKEAKTWALGYGGAFWDSNSWVPVYGMGSGTGPKSRIHFILQFGLLGVGYNCCHNTDKEKEAKQMIYLTQLSRSSN